MAGTNYMRTVISVVILAAGTVCAETPQYNPERYDVILDRSPFGSDPLLDINPEQKAAAAAAAAAKELRLCFLLESESGEIRAGFQNKLAKPGDPKSVILMVGESFMGMKLLDINLAASQATLESKGEPVVFELSKVFSSSPRLPPPQRRRPRKPRRRSASLAAGSVAANRRSSRRPVRRSRSSRRRNSRGAARKSAPTCRTTRWR